MNNRFILATALALATPAAFCQQAPAAPPAPDAQPSPREFQMRIQRDGRGDPPQTMFLERRESFDGHEGEHREMGMRHGGGMHRDWWKNPELAKRIALTPEQTKRLDDLSLQGSLNLIHLHAALEEQEVLMEPLMEALTVDEKKADLQIDKVAEARAAVEKAEVKQKLALRAVLTADQWTKLHDHHPMGGEMGPGGMHHGGNRELGPDHAEVPAPDMPAPPAE